MITYLLLLVLTFAPNGREEWILDYDMTREDCEAALYAAPLPYEHGSIVVSYACTVDTGE